ncbi:50S ribosomal protein L9 [Nanchangia anserum]|uniref:Large ribosomal subunit protein bL9 n=1 Tax=Nanchangia anserum TaxID=2692125 RepID=A0A8I0G9I3_9ACTO|nr:50S ribosomal protein L9 [Nanchangia anserum]MBD3689639.1 50S ribosomal protein L9 [Nanchangia anserum]QOX81821.1 50S ribosomal protein L9 [Nanchangia anserum]
MKKTKLILTCDVDNLGASGDVVSVAAGYARNYLLPRGMAQPWTRGAQRQIDQMVRARRSREIASIEDARAVRDAIEASTGVTISKRASDDGRLFGSVQASDIAAAVKDQLKQTVDRRKIVINQPLKALGRFEVVCKLHDDVSVTLPVLVEAE